MDKAKIVKICCIVLCALLVCSLPLFFVASCNENKDKSEISSSNNTAFDTSKNSNDMLQEKNEEEEYYEEPLSSKEDYEDIEKEVLSQPSSPAKTEDKPKQEKPVTNIEDEVADNFYTGKDYGDVSITKENLNFDGKIVTIMREWNPYEFTPDNYWKNFAARVLETEKKFNVDIVEKKWKINLAAEMLAGTVPEGHIYTMGTTNSGSIYDMINKGYISSLDDAMSKTGILMTEPHYNKYNTNLYNVNGKQWTIGTGYAKVNSAVLYNKKLLQSAGYNVSSLIESNQWNWETVTQIAKSTTLKNDSGEISQWGIGIGTTGIKALLLSNGGRLSYPNSEGIFVSGLDSENTKEALQQVYNWFNVDKVAKIHSEGEWSTGNTAFANGQIAIYFADNSAIAHAYQNLKAEDYGIAYIPKGPKADKYISYMSSGQCYVIPSTYQKITVELLLLCDELHQITAENTVQSGFKDLWNDKFHSNEQYDMWAKMYFSSDVSGVWEGSDYLSLATGTTTGFENIVNGSMIPAIWAETNHKIYSDNALLLAEKYVFTGNIN